MTPVLMLSIVAGVTTLLFLRAFANRVGGGCMVSGAVSAVSGVVTALLMAAHLGSVWLQVAAGHTAQIEFEQIASLVLGFAILIPGLLCVSLAGPLTRGELHAQKRTLAAAIFILGLTLPLAPFQILAAVMALLAISNIAILLASRTNLELTEPAA